MLIPNLQRLVVWPDRPVLKRRQVLLAAQVVGLALFVVLLMLF